MLPEMRIHLGNNLDVHPSPLSLRRGRKGGFIGNELLGEEPVSVVYSLPPFIVVRLV